MAETEKKNDEIDLFELFRITGKAISGFFLAIYRVIIIMIVFLFRRWFPIGICILIGIGLSFVAKKTLTPVYESEMTIKSNSVPNADMLNFINRLHSYSLSRNAGALSASLSIPVEKAKEIRDIEAFWVIDRNNDNIPDYVDYKNNYDVYDTVNLRMPDRIVVRTRFTSLDDLSAVSKGLISFINSNNLFRQQNDLRLSHLNEMLVRINYDIQQLDSLQKVKYFEETRSRLPDKSSQMIFLQPQNTQLLYEDIYSLYNRKQDLDEEKDLFPDIITVISDLTIPAKPFTGLRYYGSIIIPVIFILTIILLVIIEYRRRIKDYFSKY